jgi:hypothetical protein
MTEKIKIPKILQERTPEQVGFRENLTINRKKISAEMGRVIADITFDKSSITVAEYDDSDPEKFDQDNSFATYEPNLRESHHIEQKETYDYYKRLSKFQLQRLGSIAMMVPGISAIGESVIDSRESRRRQKSRRKAYLERNGTFKSNLRNKYIAHAQQYNQNTRPTR